MMPAEALAIRQPEWTQEQKDTIKQTCAPNATNDELVMFLHVCRVAGLDPLQKQIWFRKVAQKMRDGENEVILDERTGKPRWEQKVLIMAGADGLQARALRFPDCKGIRYAAVFEKDQFLVDRRTGEVKKHLSNPFVAGKCLGAWACVDREGKEPFFVVVKMEEYFDKRSPVWGGKPITMIEKVARATACRRAYPENFGGIYDPSEFAAPEEPAELEIAPVQAAVAAASNVSRLPPPAARQEEPKREPRVELEPAEERGRALALAEAAAAEQARKEREQAETDAEDVEIFARAKKSGIPQTGLKSWVESRISRKLPDEGAWNRHLTKEDREVLREELVARELEGKTPAAPQPKRNGRRGPVEDLPPRTMTVVDEVSGTTRTVSSTATPVS